MARTPAFKVKAVSGLPEWAGFADLALKCQSAGLTSHQAQCALLWCRDLTYAEIGRRLETEWQSVQRAVRQAAEAILAVYPEMQHAESGTWGQFLLRCLRNRRSSGAKSGQANPSRAEGDLMSMYVGHCSGSFSPGMGRAPEAVLREWAQTR